MKEPSLWDGFLAALGTRGFDTSHKESILQALVAVYTDPKHLDLHQLAEGFIEFDEAFRIWRTMHYLLAERMIGFKPGTGVGHTDAMHMSGTPKPSGGGCPFGHGALPREADEPLQLSEDAHASSSHALPRAEPGASFQDPGVKYLASRADLRYFPLLWEVRTRLGGGYGA